MQVTEKIAAFRARMKDENFAAVIVPTADSHASEYIADYFKTRQWLSGFTGSAGTLVVGEKEAALFVDGRYQVQARLQVNMDEIEIHHLHNEPLAEWLQEGNLENYEVYTMADHELNDMNFYLKKDPASAEDAAYVQNLQIDDIVGITINSQTNQVSAIEKVFAVNEDGEFATDVIWLE